MAKSEKYRVHEVAKDFGLPSKRIMEILSAYGLKPRNYQQSLNDHELSVIFEYLTQRHQVSGIEAIYADVKPKETPKTEAEEKPEEQPETNPEAAAFPDGNDAKQDAAPAAEASGDASAEKADAKAETNDKSDSVTTESKSDGVTAGYRRQSCRRVQVRQSAGHKSRVQIRRQIGRETGAGYNR